MILPDQTARNSLRCKLAPHLNWDLHNPDPKIRLLAGIYASIDSPRVPGAIIPVVESGHMSFVAVADHPTDWRCLAPFVMAAAGTTLTNFDGQPVASSDPVGSILRAYNLEFRRFETPAGDRDRAGKAVGALHRLIRVLQTMPVALRELPRSPPQVLHEFDLALLAGDREMSLSKLEELERRRAVDSLNLRFLTVRWHATFRQWHHLRRERWFADLCRTRRPPQVTIELLRALYEVDLGGPSLLADPAALVNRFRSRVAAEAGSLFRVLLPDLPGPAAILLALDALARSDEGRLAALRKVSSDVWEPQERSGLDSVLALGPPPNAVTTEAERSLTDSLLELQHSHVGDRALTDAQRVAIRDLVADDGPLSLHRLVNTLVSDQPRQPLSPDASETGSLEALPEDWVTDNWIDWFAALSQLSFRRSRELAERLADEVSVQEYLATVADRDRLIRVLEEALSSNEKNAIMALPHLARWLQNNSDWPRADLGPLYRTLLTAFLLFDARTLGGFRSALSILDGWLSIGPDEASYAEVLGDFQSALASLASARSLDALIDLAELLVIHPAQHAGARSAMLAELQVRLRAFGAWITRSQISILNGISDAINVPRIFEINDRRTPAADASPGWTGTIGIYTLRPAVGQRVVDAIKERAPGAEVVWRDDHVATIPLRQLAARSDVMAVDWSAAKHSATDAIRQSIDEGKLIWVNGGASSVATDILNAIEMN